MSYREYLLPLVAIFLWLRRFESRHVSHPAYIVLTGTFPVFDPHWLGLKLDSSTIPVDASPEVWIAVPPCVAFAPSLLLLHVKASSPVPDRISVVHLYS